MSFRAEVCLIVWLCVCLIVGVSVCLCMCLCYVCVFACMFVLLLACFFVCVFVCLFACSFAEDGQDDQRMVAAEYVGRCMVSILGATSERGADGQPGLDRVSAYFAGATTS